MEFWYVLIGIGFLILLLPYIRLFFKRLNCACKINKLCRKKGYKKYSTHLFWFLGNQYGMNCDLYIETANEIFAIKLFGVTRRLSVLILKQKNAYSIRKKSVLPTHGGGIRTPIDSRQKPIPTYNFRYKYKEIWETKIPRRILLVNPISSGIKYRPSHGSEVSVDVGDIVNGMEIHSLSYLLEKLENTL